MKILFVTSFLGQAQTGAAIFARLFLEWAKERSIETDIISIEEGANLIPVVKNIGFYSRIPVLESYHRSYIYYKTVQKQLKKIKYDFIFFNNVIESLHTAKLIRDTPVVAFLHDENFLKDYFENPSMKRTYYRAMMQRMEKKAVRHLDKVLTNSKYMKSQIEQEYNKHPLEVDYMYFRSFDLDHLPIHIVETNSTKNEIRILFVKHDYHRGGLTLLAKAIHLLDHKVKLRIVGPSREKQGNIASIVEGIDFELCPNRSREEIAQDYAWCDIFCVPSLSEALGLSNMEAIYAEKPVVAFDIPVNKELYEKKDIIRLAPCGDMNSLAKKMNEAVEASDSYKVKEAKKWLLSSISKELFYAKLDHIFSV